VRYPHYQEATNKVRSRRAVVVVVVRVAFGSLPFSCSLRGGGRGRGGGRRRWRNVWRDAYMRDTRVEATLGAGGNTTTGRAAAKEDASSGRGGEGAFSRPSGLYLT